MTDKVLVIISSADPAKARTGILYATNALVNGWLEAVKLIFFGPSQKLLLDNVDLQQAVQHYQEMGETVVACKFLADAEKSSQSIAALGVQVDYVGEMISNFIKEGYTPMVW